MVRIASSRFPYFYPNQGPECGTKLARAEVATLEPREAKPFLPSLATASIASILNLDLHTELVDRNRPKYFICQATTEETNEVGRKQLVQEPGS